MKYWISISACFLRVLRDRQVKRNWFVKRGVTLWCVLENWNKWESVSSAQGSHASLLVLESTWIFLLTNSRPWRYLKTGQVLECPWILFHRSLKVLEFTKSNYAISATSLNNICIGLECMCFTYLEICQVFCLTQDLLIIIVFCFYRLKLSCNHRNRH